MTTLDGLRLGLRVTFSSSCPEITYALLPDRQMDGVFQALVSRIDLWSGCPGAQRSTETSVGDEPAGAGFWANAMTTRAVQGVADPRPALRNVSTPVLVMRSECDDRAWAATREYRDLLTNAVMLAIEDAGHAIPTDRSELYRRAVLMFLLDQPLPQTPYTGVTAPW